MSTSSDAPTAGYAATVADALEGCAAGGDASARAVWKALGAAGALRALAAGAPSTHAEPWRLDALVRALDRRLPLGVTLAVCVQAASALPLLVGSARGGPTARAAELALAGDAVTALGATDAGAAGSDLAALTTTVELADEAVTVTGGKRWITGATFADHILVLARHRPGTHFTNFTWVLVPSSASGVAVVPADTDLLPGSGLGHVMLRDVSVPAGHVLGRVGDGLARFGRHVASERYVGARWAATVMRRVLRDTRRMVRERAVTGGALLEQASVREQLVRGVLEQQRLEAWCDRVAARLDHPSASIDATLLKVGAAGALEAVLALCAPLHGADGFDRDGIQRLRSEAAMFGIAGGATGALLATAADQVDRLLEER